MEEMITKNFSKKELSCPCCSKMEMKASFIERLQKLRDVLASPLVITSAYRCKKHNDSLPGSARHSQHMDGVAVDIACSDASFRFLLIAEAVRQGFRGIGIAKTFIHLDSREEPSPVVVWTYV